MALQPEEAASGDGGRLLPSVVDELAASDPERIVYSVAKTRNPSEGFHDISARALARAVDRCSWHLEATLGRGQAFPTVAYMGPQDAFYIILVLACIKTGYKAFLTSPRNSPDAHLSLFEATQCKTLLVPHGFTLPVIRDLSAAGKIRIVEIQGMAHWLQDSSSSPGDDRPYPYTKTYSQAASDPIAVLHTSGSTGMPKPIVQTHALHAPLDAFTALPSLGHRPVFSAMCRGSRAYLGVPLFHAAGLSLCLAGCLYSGYTMVLGPFPPSGEIANAVHVHGNVQHSILPPFTLIELAREPEHLENLGRLHQITFGGGLLPKEVGDRVAARTRLLNCLGSTETGTFPVQLCDDAADWAYLSMSPVVGCEYRHVSGDLYEQVIVRDPRLARFQGVFSIFPDLDEWHMRDLYSRHPTKDDLWLYRGRLDDIIVFSSGEKLNPVDMEALICGNPAVNGALVAGFGRFQSSLLVEAKTPPASEEDKAELLGAIWPSVEAANKKCPSHGRVHRHMIIFTSADKPMARASKGTVQRKTTIGLYESELDALYRENDGVNGHANGHANGHTNGHANGTNGVVDGDGSEDVVSVVKRMVAASTDITLDGLDLDADLFELGLDSLQVTLIARQLSTWLSARDSSAQITPKVIYSNPSVKALAAVLNALELGKPHDAVDNSSSGSREERMQKLYQSHARRIFPSARRPEANPTGELVVLLLGATGSLGGYILDSLLRDPRVTQVYCLNRGSKGSERLRASLGAKKLADGLLAKVCHLDADLSQPLLGLSNTDGMHLLGSVTTVIHSAWQVDFNQSLASFGNQVATVKELIDFSVHSRLGAKIVFISSISSVSNWQALSGEAGKVPEVISDDWRIAEDMGYAESKCVAERLLDTAARVANVPAVVCRVGQIAGPTTEAGAWPRREWVPSLIASSKHLAKLPASLGRHDRLDWVPVDTVGQIVVDLATALSRTPQPGATVYHVSSPASTTWGELLPTIQQGLSPGKGLDIVPLAEWVDALHQSQDKSGGDVAGNPALKLLSFFDDLVSHGEQPLLLDTKNSSLASPALASLEAVNVGLMENWMRQWAF